ncbi:MAG: type II toxin-antitoxin system HicA family toxin [Clostridiales Family XIII bacterium]|nr:type II toxin-antitoxin system HicA family toxin [Clostridiales Family XIII bacterium]
MGKRIEKLIERLKSRPKTFKYSDAKRVLEHFGYQEDTGGKTSGSYVQFVHSEHAPISLHKPHPGNELKAYLVRYIAEQLEAEGLM